MSTHSIKLSRKKANNMKTTLMKKFKCHTSAEVTSIIKTQTRGDGQTEGRRRKNQNCEKREQERMEGE